jgi:hypothetical protein
MAKTILVLTPSDYLDLAKQHGLSRNKAVELSGISTRSWAKYCYQGFIPSINIQVKLATIAIANGWL